MNIGWFDKLCEEGNLTDAYMVIRNEFNRNCADTSVFKKFEDLAFRLASLNITFDERKTYLNDASNALALYSDNVEMDESTLLLIKETTVKIGEIYNQIATDENSYYEKGLKETREKNTEILQSLADVNQEIRKVKEQKDFDKLLTRTTELEMELEKDAFTETQQNTYNVLTKHFSETISKKMEELNNAELLNVNKKAVKAFKYAFDTFTDQKSKYKESESNLKALVTSTLFAFDSRDLFNETLIYYNHIYSLIFNEVNDDLKFRLTEWALVTAKTKK